MKNIITEKKKKKDKVFEYSIFNIHKKIENYLNIKYSDINVVII